MIRDARRESFATHTENDLLSKHPHIKQHVEHQGQISQGEKRNIDI